MIHAIPPLLDAILAQYSLPWTGDHGIAHWARVWENGTRLAPDTGADLEIVQLFALFHDSRRLNEYNDPEHGPRAAAFALTLRGTVIQLSDERFHLLHQACAGHTHDHTHPDPTVQTCYDADRLDLGRVGITPDPRRLCTEAARDPATLAWANSRGMLHYRPALVLDLWGIDLDRARTHTS